MSLLPRRMIEKQGGDDAGIAMPVVIMVSFLVTALMVSVAAVALSSAQLSRSDEDWQSALNAANAGVDEYISRLNDDGNYWQFLDPSAPYSSGSTGDLPSGEDANPMFEGWTALPGSNPSDIKRPEIRYELDNSEYLTTGLLKLQASGKVGEAVRTVEALVRRRSFIDFLYFTDFETKDPALYNSQQWPYWSPATAEDRCAKYYYAGRNSNCTNINFAGADEIKGPLHTNDAFLVCVGCGSGSGPYFRGDTSTSYQPNNPSTNRYRTNNSGSGNPSFQRAGDPRWVTPLTLPPSNTAIKREVDSTYTDTPGCLYSGPTRFYVKGDKIDVLSPWTTYTSRCGGGANVTSVDLPENGVIYVQDVPANPSADPNTNSSPASCYRSNCVGFPRRNDITNYSRTAGDVFMWGELDGLLTVAAENDIIIRGDLTYESGDGGDDMLGLVANNNLEVYHPVYRSRNGYYNFTSYDSLGPHWGSNDEPDIYAALLSVNHSIRVQNYDRGNQLGDLNIYGALAQRYRGIVGLIGSTGYDKNYNYDSRLKYQAPPKFLDPVQAAFGLALWSEIDSAY